MSDPRAASKLCVGLLPVLLSAACTQSAPSPGTAAAATQSGETPPAAVADTSKRFAHDDAGQPGLALPEAIARALGTDERVLSCAEGTRDGSSLFQPDWVAVRRFDLDDDGRADWIVNGRHACLRDGNAAAWWAYADGAQGQRVVLASAMARSLEVTGARTQGFRDLRLQRADSEVAVARYDGAMYALPQTATQAAPTPSPSDADSADTVAGRLQIAALPRDDGREVFAITLAGRELRRTGAGGDFPDYPAPQILQRYEQGIVPFDEVLVFQQQMRGNACNGGPLWILGLRRDGSHAISKPIDFCGGKAPQLSATRDQLTIVLPGGPPNRGEGTIPTETWRYRNGEVSRVAAP